MRFLTLVILLTTLPSCRGPSPLTWMGPYHMDIQQGNALTQETIAKLKPGMTRNQVRFLLGTPLIADLFHANRWDYKYQLYQDGKEVKDFLFTVYFINDVVSRVEGTGLPSEERPQPTTTSGPTSAPVSAAP